MNDTNTIDGLTNMKCKGCDEVLTQSELRVMSQFGFDKCVRCRKKEQDIKPVITKGKYGYKNKR